MSRRAFTLIELMVTVAIMAILVSFLLPAMTSAWQMYNTTRCKVNLKCIWDAQSSWRTDTQSSVFTPNRDNPDAVGRSWPTELAPYVEGRPEIFICPCALVKVAGFGQGAGPATETGGGYDEEIAATFIPESVDLAVRITWRPGQNWQPYMTQDVYDMYPVTVPLDGTSLWSIHEDRGNGTIRWSVDDNYLGHRMGYSDPYFDDVVLDVRYVNGLPTTWNILRLGALGSTAWFTYSLLVNDEVAVSDISTESIPIGEEVAIPTGAYPYVGTYGLSQGTYRSVSGGVNQVNARQLLILDYPLLVADYNDDGKRDDWPKFFADESTAKAWEDDYGLTVGPGLTWKHYTALRHFGQANVLFCDGHIKALSKEDLEETLPLWRFIGR